MIALPRGRGAAAWIVAFGLIWGARCAISESPAALHQDMLEAYVWGQEFQLGYNQHPPFWAWMCGLWFAVMPRTDASFAALSALNSTLGLWGAWRLVGCFARDDERVAATAMLLLTPFYTFFAYKYNANSIFVSVWPWALYFFERAAERRGWGDAVALGLFVAAALLSKYFALILCVTMGLAALTRADRKVFFASPAPYVAAATTALLIAPHLYWLAAHKAPPLRYLSEVSGLGWLAALNNVQAVFFGSALALAGPAALTVALAQDRDPRAALARVRTLWREPRYRELTVLAFAPLGLALLAGLVMQVKLATVMLIGTFPLSALWMIRTLPPADPARLARVGVRLASVVVVGALVVAPLLAAWMILTSDNPKYTDPRKELAAAATAFWRETTDKPLLYVAGTRYEDDGIAFYSSQRPHGFTGFELGRCPWVTPQKIAVHGLLTECRAGDEDCRAETRRYSNANARSKTVTLSHVFMGHVGPPMSFEITAIPPP